MRGEREKDREKRKRNKKKKGEKKACTCDERLRRPSSVQRVRGVVKRVA